MPTCRRGSCASLRISAAGSRTLTTSSFQRARQVGLEQIRGPAWWTGTPWACYRSIFIVADGRLDVCDGAHWAFVMKKKYRVDCGRAAESRALGGRGIPSFK